MYPLVNVTSGIFKDFKMTAYKSKKSDLKLFNNKAQVAVVRFQEIWGKMIPSLLLQTNNKLTSTQ